MPLADQRGPAGKDACAVWPHQPVKIPLARAASQDAFCAVHLVVGRAGRDSRSDRLVHASGKPALPCRASRARELAGLTFSKFGSCRIKDLALALANQGLPRTPCEVNQSIGKQG